MFKDLFGPQSLSYMLRGGLEEASETHRAIADRVANAIRSSTNVDFNSELEKRTGRSQLDEVDLQRDMSALADTQLRYEADAKLLQAAYTRLRSAIRDRG
jgi:flagellar basal body rod protein FlgB